MFATIRTLAFLAAVAFVGTFTSSAAEASGYGHSGYARPVTVYVAPRPVYTYPAPTPRVIVVRPTTTVYRPSCH